MCIPYQVGQGTPQERPRNSPGTPHRHASPRPATPKARPRPPNKAFVSAKHEPPRPISFPWRASDTLKMLPGPLITAMLVGLMYFFFRVFFFSFSYFKLPFFGPSYGNDEVIAEDRHLAGPIFFHSILFFGACVVLSAGARLAVLSRRNSLPPTCQLVAARALRLRTARFPSEMFGIEPGRGIPCDGFHGRARQDGAGRGCAP